MLDLPADTRDALADVLLNRGVGFSDAYAAAAAAMRALPDYVMDDSPTQRLPPIRETVFRRPPPPQVRQLARAELLRALAAEIERDLAEEEDQ